MTDYPRPPYPEQQQAMPGHTDAMKPRPDHGETSYVGSGRLAGKSAIITGGDSGIGRAVAIAYAREGANLLISYLSEEEEDARETQKWVEEAGRKAVLMPGDISSAQHCRAIIDKAVEELGGIDILVNNAAHQASFEALGDISDREWELTFAVNIHAMFYLSKAAAPHLEDGGVIINTSSINADQPNAHLLADKNIRVNCVAPGPVWTPLIPSTMPPEAVKSFGENTPIGRAAQPRELAPPYVMLASDEASYMSGATVPVTGGRPFI